MLPRYLQIGMDEVLPLVTSGPGQALAEGPQQKGRNPKNYHAQYQPQGGREHVPNKKARDAARARRKKR